MPRSLRRSFSILVALAVVGSWGCSREEGIERYSVPKPKPLKAVAADPMAGHPPIDGQAPIDGHPPMAAPVDGSRIFGAIILRNDTAWFVKATGSPETLAPQLQNLLVFLKSLRFGEGGLPTWTLPDGWNEKPPENRFRYRTFLAGPADGPLDISLSSLPKNEDDVPYLLANVNRWRQQVGIPPTDAQTLRRQLLPIELNDGNIALIVVLAPEVGEASQPSSIKYDVPQGWTDDGSQGERKASLSLVDGDRRADIAVTSFPASAPEIADPVANVNRWRGQIGLAEATRDEILKASEDIKVDGHNGSYVELFAPDEAAAERAILVAMFRSGDDMWFVKLSGDGALAKREREAFKKFLASMRLEPAAEKPTGANDGK